MKLFFRYLASKARTLAVFGLFSALFAAAFALCRVPLGAVLYPTALCLLFGLFFLLLDFFRVKKKHDLLSHLTQEDAPIPDELPEPDTPAEADYALLIRKLQETNCRMLADERETFDDLTDYYTAWTHQIKTPIASMKLALQNEDTSLARRLSSDLTRIEQYAEMALTFVRLDAGAGDYVFREVRLDDVIRPVVRKFAPEFIGRHLRLDYTGIPDRVVTDEKWLGFVIGQVLSNALKYTREGGIRIFLEEEKTLCIADTGIGIAASDLPRIFEKGYTGFNGRTDRSATGLGLYLCRRICGNLNADISAQSEPGKGTVIRIDLSRYPLKAE